MREENLGPVANPDGSPTELTREMLAGTGRDPGKFALVSAIMAYEAGDLDEDGELELFQRLVDNGMAWSLQGHYGRTATALLNAGRIRPARVDTNNPGAMHDAGLVTSLD